MRRWAMILAVVAGPVHAGETQVQEFRFASIDGGEIGFSVDRCTELERYLFE